jgi:hypothetical protein
MAERKIVIEVSRKDVAGIRASSFVGVAMVISPLACLLAAMLAIVQLRGSLLFA